MKAILEFNLPEDQDDMNYALAGVDALLVIDDLLSEIRSKLKHDSGEFKSWIDFDGKQCTACEDTLEKVREVLLQFKERRNLPELV